MTANLWKMNIDGSGSEQLTHAGFVIDWGAEFSPSMKRIAFYRNVYANGTDLMILNMETGEISRPARNVGFHPNRIRWKNDDELYYFTGITDSKKTCAVDLKKDAKTDRISDAADVSFSAEIEMTIYCPKEKYRYKIGLRPLDSGESWTPLTNKRQFNVSRAGLNRPGDSVVFMDYVRKNDGLDFNYSVYLMDLETKRPEKILGFYNGTLDFPPDMRVVDCVKTE